MRTNNGLLMAELAHAERGLACYRFAKATG
jgi:hypothetical protein